MADHPDAEEFYRLRQFAVDQFDGSWPSNAEIQASGRRAGIRASFERDLTLLKRGQSVPKKVAEAFVGHLRNSDRVEWQNATLESIAALDPYAARERGPTNDWWDWSRIVASVQELFVDTRWGMYFADPAADCLSMARGCMRTVGYLHAGAGDPVDEASCVRRAEGIMNRTRDEYAAWLRRMHEWHFRTSFYVTTPDGAGGRRLFQRVGMASLLPVTRAAFDAIASGNLAEMEIDESHLSNPSPYLFIHGIAEPEAGCPAAAAAVDKAQSRCMFYQMAYYTREVRPFRPSLVTFAGTPKYGERLEQMGFRPTGSLLRTTDKPLMVLQPGAGWRDPLHYVRYKTFRFILELFRGLNRADWRDEDRRRR